MYRSEVWMSAEVTPWASRAAVTRLTPWLACCSADSTEGPLTWTPMDKTSWFGVPVTVPVPVTVIRAAPAVAVKLDATCVPDTLRAADEGDALPMLVPSANAPITMTAAAAPIAGAL